MILENLKNSDVKTALETLKDRILDDKNPGWMTGAAQKILDDIEERLRQRETEWWRDVDCQPPGPAKKKPRLRVEKRSYKLKQGGTEVVKVIVENRAGPWSGLIHVALRLLPRGVTAPTRTIPADPDPKHPDDPRYNYIEIPLDVAGDAPVNREPQAFAKGWYGYSEWVGETLTSDGFEVIVE